MRHKLHLEQSESSQRFSKPCFAGMTWQSHSLSTWVDWSKLWTTKSRGILWRPLQSRYSATCFAQQLQLLLSFCGGAHFEFGLQTTSASSAYSHCYEWRGYHIRSLSLCLTVMKTSVCILCQACTVGLGSRPCFWLSKDTSLLDLLFRCENLRFGF